MTRTCSLGGGWPGPAGNDHVAAKHRVQERDELELGEGVAYTDAGSGAERAVRLAHLSMLARGNQPVRPWTFVKPPRHHLDDIAVGQI